MKFDAEHEYDGGFVAFFETCETLRDQLIFRFTIEKGAAKSSATRP